jgi:hypothetical protein
MQAKAKFIPAPSDGWRKCENCGREYKSLLPDRKYCSTECEQEATGEAETSD